MTRRQANGFGLVETLLTLGALSALSLGIYWVLSPASAAAQTKREQDNLRDLSTAVDRSFGLLGSFQGVSASRVLEDGLAPTRMVDGSNLRTAWGTSVTIAPHAVNAPGDGFVVVYPFAPADVCPRLASAVSPYVYDIRVEGVSMFDNGQLNVNATAAACGQHDTATMEFVYHSGLVAGTAVAAPPLALPPAPPSVSAPGTAPIGGPVGPVGPVGGAAPVAPVSSAPMAPPATVSPALPPAPTPVSPNTPPAPAVPAPSSPVSSVAACVIPPTENRSVATCPAGTWGLTNQERRWWCGEIGGNYEAWEAPQAGAWTDTTNTCSACPAPFSQSEQQWVNLNSACPAGQTGSITWQAEQSRTRTGSYNCPAGSTALPAATFTGWSGWSNTGATRNLVNTCATPAPPPAPAPSPTCPDPSIDDRGYTSCSWDGSGWSCYVPGSGWQDVVCNVPSEPAPACALPSPSTQTNVENRVASQTLGCPVGQSGVITQTRNEQRTQTRTAYCPAPTGAYSWGDWSAWSEWTPVTGWATTSSTCATSVVGHVGWWHDGLGYVAGFAGNKCVRTYEVQYQLLVTNTPIGGYTAWYRRYPDESNWKPVTPSNPCHLMWDTPGTPYPQFPGDVMPTP